MHLHVFQHVPFEGPSSIALWAAGAGHQLTITRWFAGETPPPLEQIDWLILLGGPMGVADENVYGWLKKEKEYLQAAVKGGKVVLGICLGAQLIAGILGAVVQPNAEKEIGWFPTTSLPAAKKMPIGSKLPDGMEVFHWHGDTFTIPKGAVHLMRSKACENQAFLYGDRVLALQFHLETTRQSAAALIEHCADDLTAAPFIQNAETILKNSDRFRHINRYMAAILNYLSGLPKHG
ncbi:MAG: type 1 glutamine amidotransferase [Deltaproteobacteria bacterium]|nr:type 1 glutamine amidotransferase [Candidatus Anaeroferrophillus wilburensis]